MARSIAKRMRTIQQKVARGIYNPKKPRTSEEVQQERKRKGLSTIDDQYGGVPNMHQFPALKPLYKTKDGLYMVYFPRESQTLAWWRTAHAEVAVPSRGMILRVFGEKELVLEVTNDPAGEWKKIGSTKRNCTGQMRIRIVQ